MMGNKLIRLHDVTLIKSFLGFGIIWVLDYLSYFSLRREIACYASQYGIK